MPDRPAHVVQVALRNEGLGVPLVEFGPLGCVQEERTHGAGGHGDLVGGLEFGDQVRQAERRTERVRGYSQLLVGLSLGYATQRMLVDRFDEAAYRRQAVALLELPMGEAG